MLIADTYTAPENNKKVRRRPTAPTAPAPARGAHQHVVRHPRLSQTRREMFAFACNECV